MQKAFRKAQLLYTDTDSFVYNIETKDVYKTMGKISTFFDASNYPETHPSYSIANKKVVGKFKDEEGGKIISEFVGLRSKLYSYQVDGKEVKKCKGIKKGVIENQISHDEYKQVLMGKSKVEKEMTVIRSRDHAIHTETMTKIALSGDDDKRIILDDGISTHAIGF